MNVLSVRCTECKVASSCPQRGTSPVSIGKKVFLCRLMGGYGREKVDPSILSEESKARSDRDGPCLTIAEVPEVEEQTVTYRVVKIFHQPIVHDREKVGFDYRTLGTHGYKIERD